MNKPTTPNTRARGPKLANMAERESDAERELFAALDRASPLESDDLERGRRLLRRASEMLDQAN